MKIKKTVGFVCMALVILSFLLTVSFVRADNTWEPVANDLTGSFWSIAYGNGTYVATWAQVLNNAPSPGSFTFTGRIYTSPDLATWTKQGSDIVLDGSGNIGSYSFPVTFSSQTSDKFVAWPYCTDSTGAVSASKMFTSDNGLTWTEKYAGNDAYLGVANVLSGYYSTHVTRTYNASSDTTTLNYKIRHSSDLTTWTDRYAGTYSGSGSSFSYTFSISHYDQGYFAVLNIANSSNTPSTITSKVLLSSDGITWTERYTGDGFISGAGLRDTLVISLQAPFSGGTTNGKIFTTTDWGNTWTKRYDQTFTGNASMVLQSNNNDALVGWIGVNTAGAFNMKMIYSAEGVTWTNTYDQIFTGSGSFSLLSGYANPYFLTHIAVNTTFPTQTLVKLLLSPAGSVWTEGYSNTFSGIASFTPGYRNGNFLAWGWNGTSAAILRYAGPVTVWLAGTAREPLTEAPVGSATVSIVGDPSINTTTAADGRLSLTGITPGIPYVSKVAKDGYWPLYTDSLPYTPPGSPDYRVNNRYGNALSLIPNSQVTAWGVAANKGAVLLRLIDSTTGGTGQINGATVTAIGQPSGKTYTASYFDTPYVFTGSSTYPNGRAFFLNVDSGDTLTINASALGWTFPQQTFAAFSAGITAGAFVGLPTGTTYPISGVVRDGSSNLPLAAATLKITDVSNGTEKARARANESGYYMVNLLSPGDYTVTASKPGYGSVSYQGVVTLSDTSPNRTVNISMSQAEPTLYSGWNFISFAKLPQGTTAMETVLADVYSKVNVVWGWDNQNRVWQKWKPGAASNTLSTIESGKGYWLYMDASGNIDTTGWTPPPSTTVHLLEGWNLIGYLGADNAGVSATLGSISGKWQIVWGWDSGSWSAKHETISTLPAPIQPLTNFNQGKAYWIKIRTTDDWTQ